MSLDQLSIGITLNYTFPEMPAELTFWQQFRDSDGAANVHAQLMIRREGELVMLPASLGSGMLVSFPFDWTTDPEPIAERKSLSAVVCGPDNRPSNAVLVFEDSSIDVRLHVPVPRNVREGELPDRFRERILSGVSLLVDGKSLLPELVDGEKEEPGSHHSNGLGDDRLIVISFNGQFEQPIHTVDFNVSPSALEIPFLYLSVLEFSKSSENFVLPAAKATYTWHSTP
jgi:hypothetical protein